MAYGYKKNNRQICLFLGIFSLVLFLLQGSVVPFLAGAKNIPLPDILFCFVCIMPCFADKRICAIFALAQGFLADLFINYPTAFSPIVYLLGVCIVPVLYGCFSRVNTVTAAVCAIPPLLLKGLVGLFGVISAFEDASFFDVISRYLLPELLINFACVLVIAFMSKLIYKKLKLGV